MCKRRGERIGKSHAVCDVHIRAIINENLNNLFGIILCRLKQRGLTALS